MSSKLKPFSFVGVSNPEMFLSENDLSGSAMEFSFLVRPPPLEFRENQFQIAPFQDVHDEPQDKGQQKQDQQQQKQEEEKCKFVPLSVGEFKVDHEDQENDGFKTPTSSDHKIPTMLKCPPAPRKPKTPKRKAFRARILLDLTKEIESLFPPALLADLGNKIKKVRQGSDFK